MDRVLTVLPSLMEFNMISRKEAVELGLRMFDYDYTPKQDKQGRTHFGKIEFYELIDAIYGPEDVLALSPMEMLRRLAEDPTSTRLQEQAAEYLDGLADAR